jgi:hypothetical protein
MPGSTIYRYHHVGIPVPVPIPGMEIIEHLKIRATDHQSNPFGIQWMYYEPGCPLPELVRTVPHVAFEVDDLDAALHDHTVIIPPNSPSPGVRVALIEVEGGPVEFLEFTSRSAGSHSDPEDSGDDDSPRD